MREDETLPAADAGPADCRVRRDWLGKVRRRIDDRMARLEQELRGTQVADTLLEARLELRRLWASERHGWRVGVESLPAAADSGKFVQVMTQIDNPDDWFEGRLMNCDGCWKVRCDDLSEWYLEDYDGWRFVTPNAKLTWTQQREDNHD